MNLNHIWHQVDNNCYLRSSGTWGCGNLQTLWSRTTGDYYFEIFIHGFPVYFNHHWWHTKGAAPRFVIRSNVYLYRTQRGLASRNQIRFPLSERHQSAPLGTRQLLCALPLCVHWSTAVFLASYWALALALQDERNIHSTSKNWRCGFLMPYKEYLPVFNVGLQCLT